MEPIHYFVSSAVSGALSSGKFEPDDILMITERARDAFKAAMSAYPSHAPLAPTPRPAPEVEPAVPAAPADSFSGWANDRCFYGKKDWTAFGKPWPDVTWSELLQHAKTGDEKAIKALRHMASSSIGDDPKWQEANKRKIARAACLLNLAARG